MALQIRPAQMRAFEEEIKHREITALAGYLRRALPHAASGHPNLERRVSQALNQANKFLGRPARTKIAKRAVTLWVRLMFEVSPGFSQDEDVRRVLENKADPPETRVLSLLHESSRINWKSVTERTSTTRWEDLGG